MLGFNAERNVSRHDPAGNVRHPAGHHRHQFRSSEIWQEGTDGQRRFGLSHEYAGRDVQRFRATCAHHASHDPRRDLDDELHHTVVVEHGEECRDKDDGRQYLKREIEAEMRTLLSKFTKNKLRTDKGITEKPIYYIAGFLKNSPTGLDSQHEYCAGKLQA